MLPVARSAPWRALGALVLILAALPARAQDAADPFDATRDAFMATEDTDERLAIVKAFLAEHPDHERVPVVLGAGADLFVEVRDDRPAAVALAEGQLSVSTDPVVLDGVRDVLVGLYSDPVYAFKLKNLVAEHYDAATMSFGQHLTVLEAAAAAEAWDLVDAQAKVAMDRANAEAFAADYPDRDFSEEEIEEAGRNRQGLVATFMGWSIANQGNAKKGIGMFKKAEEMLRPTFLGVPTNQLYRFWGQSLLMAGDSEAGFEKLTLAHIFGGDEKAGEIARTGYANFRPRESYDDFVWSVRLANAPTMVDFAAMDYQQQSRTFAQLKGGEATLLAFWFPT
jgi:hypothetical protein